MNNKSFQNRLFFKKHKNTQKTLIFFLTICPYPVIFTAAKIIGVLMEDLVCPKCNAPLDEKELRKSLVCPHCKTNLRDAKYLDFLELLMFHDIVDDIDFFDVNLYRDEIIKDDREDYDEPDIDPSKFEKHKEVWDEFEDDMELKKGLVEDADIEDEAWNIFDPDVLVDEDWEEENGNTHDDKPAPKTQKRKKKK